MHTYVYSEGLQAEIRFHHDNGEPGGDVIVSREGHVGFPVPAKALIGFVWDVYISASLGEWFGKLVKGL